MFAITDGVTNHLTLEKCIFLNCYAGTVGGAMAIIAYNTQVKECIFKRNLAIGGGGFHMMAETEQNVSGLIENSLFVDNRARFTPAIYINTNVIRSILQL